MRIVAIIILCVTLLVGGFFVFCYVNMDMEIESVTVSVQSASDAQDVYTDIRTQLSEGTFTGTRYQDVEFLMADSFSFLTLTVQMRNGGLFPMEWIQIDVAPDPADVVRLPAERTPSLAAGTRAAFETVLLTRAGASTSRTVTVTYYVLGQKMVASYVMPGS